MAENDDEQPAKPPKRRVATSLDETDLQIAYARFAGLALSEIASAVEPALTIAGVRHRLQAKKSFFDAFPKWASGIQAKYHTTKESQARDEWRDEIALREEAVEAEFSRRMMPARVAVDEAS